MSTPLIINNASFETTVLADDNDTNSIAQWVGTGSFGEYNPKIDDLDPASISGSNVAYIDDGGSISQTLGVNYEAGKFYEFSLSIGDGDFGGVEMQDMF